MKKVLWRIIELLVPKMTMNNAEKADTTVNILGVDVVSTSASSVLEKVAEKIKSASNRPYFIVTAYSETFLEKDPEFRKALKIADLIVADGVSVAAAMDYLTSSQNGLQIGLNILEGKYSTVRGVELFKNILNSNKYRVYLSGGFNVAPKIAMRYPNVVGWDNGDKDLEKINKTHPDILFVALGRFKQEIWISQNLDKLNSKVVIGVGSAFDEVADNWQIPAWVDQMGLKWLWRVTKNPKHLVRAFRASVLFPMEVWREKK